MDNLSKLLTAEIAELDRQIRVARRYCLIFLILFLLSMALSFLVVLA